MDQMTDLQYEQSLKHKMQTLLFLSVAKQGVAFDSDPNFLRYKRKLKNVSQKINKWH